MGLRYLALWLLPLLQTTSAAPMNLAALLDVVSSNEEVAGAVLETTNPTAVNAADLVELATRAEVEAVAIEEEVLSARGQTATVVIETTNSAIANAIDAVGSTESIATLAERDDETGRVEDDAIEILDRRRLVGYLEALVASRERAKKLALGEDTVPEGGEIKKRTASPDDSDIDIIACMNDSLSFAIPIEDVPSCQPGAVAGESIATRELPSLSKRKIDVQAWLEALVASQEEAKKLALGEDTVPERGEIERRTASPAEPLSDLYACYLDSFAFHLPLDTVPSCYPVMGLPTA